MTTKTNSIRFPCFHKVMVTRVEVWENELFHSCFEFSGTFFASINLWSMAFNQISERILSCLVYNKSK